MKRKTFYQTVVAVTSFFAVACAVLVGSGKMKNLLSKTNAANPTYSVTLNSAVFGASGLTTSYQTNISQNLGNDKPVLNYFLAKKDGSNNLVLAPAGKLYNYSTSGTYKGRITNIQSITVNYSGGTLYVQEGLAGGAEVYGDKSALTSGQEKALLQSPNYLVISNSRAATTISSINVVYSCVEAGFEVERLGTSYNGMDANGNVYTLTRNGSSVSVAGQSGTISINGSGNFTISLASNTIVYTGTVSSDYKTLTFLNKSGSNSGSAPTLAEMNRIYVVDDFELYTQNGTAYSGNASHANDQSLAYVNSSTASDLRAAYYSDYGGGSNNTWVNGSNFQVPTSGDYLNTTTAVKHTGSKSALFKASTGGWMRHWSREIFDQNQHYNFGSGNRLSFWAHGGYKDTACTTNGTQAVELRVQVYYQNFVITDSNRNSTTYGSGTTTKSIPAGSSWNEYTINIDPSKKVYAVNIMLNNSGLSANQYIPIDDITIYTQPIFEPTKTYTETSTKFTKSYHGTVKLSMLGQSYTFTMKLAIGANDYVYAYCGENMQPQSYTISGSNITIVTTGSYKGYSYGTWSGTLSNNNNTITIQKSGITDSGVKSYITSSSIVLTADTKLVDGSEGNLSTLESSIKRQYYNGSSWVTDTSNSDRFTIENNYYIQGNNAIKVRAYSGNNMRIIMDPTKASQVGPLDSVSFWYYVPAGYDYTISVYTYKSTTPSSSDGQYAQQDTKTYSASNPSGAGWHFMNMGLNKAGSFGRNFAIFISTTSAPTIIDSIGYF